MITEDYQHHQKEDNQTFVTSWQTKLREHNTEGEAEQSWSGYTETTQFQDLIYRYNNQTVKLIKEQTE